MSVSYYIPNVIGSTGGLGDVSGPGSSTDNAIVRFDSTTGKLIQNSAITIDDSGRLSINNANTPTGKLSIAATGSSTGATNNEYEIELIHASSTSGTPSVVGKRSKGTLAAPTAVTANNVLTRWEAQGYTGTTFASAVRIESKASESWDDSNQGSKFEFSIKLPGTTALTSAISVGNTGIGDVTLNAGDGASNFQHLLWAADSGGDIGAAGDSRPRSIYAAVNIIAGGQLRAASIGIGNSVAGTTPGTVTKSWPVFDAAGAPLGFVAIYDAIT